MERTLEELCELLATQKKSLKSLEEDSKIAEYKKSLEAEKELTDQIKSIIKTNQKSYESQSLKIVYQYRSKKTTMYDIPGIKTQGWANAVLEEKVNDERFNALMEAVPDMKNYITGIKEVDVSAVIIRLKEQQE